MTMSALALHGVLLGPVSHWDVVTKYKSVMVSSFISSIYSPRSDVLLAFVGFR